jgi:hypothetical protein
MIHRLGRPARLVLVSAWTACDSLLIRRPIWTLSSDIQNREDQNRPLVQDRLPGHPHQLTTERGYQFRFTVLPEVVVAQPVFSVSALLQGPATISNCYSKQLLKAQHQKLKSGFCEKLVWFSSGDPSNVVIGSEVVMEERPVALFAPSKQQRQTGCLA